MRRSIQDAPGTKLLHPRRLVQGTRFVGLVDKLLLVSCRHHGPEQRELVLTSRLLLACRLPDVTGLHPGRKLGISPFGFGLGKLVGCSFAGDSSGRRLSVLEE